VGIQRLKHTPLDLLHVDIPSGPDSRVAQRPLRILECPVKLKMIARRSAHHLKRNEPVRDAELPGNRPAPTRRCLSLAYASPIGRKHQSLRGRIWALIRRIGSPSFVGEENHSLAVFGVNAMKILGVLKDSL
jgi:hypothetical protein